MNDSSEREDNQAIEKLQTQSPPNRPPLKKPPPIPTGEDRRSYDSFGSLTSSEGNFRNLSYILTLMLRAIVSGSRCLDPWNWTT